MLHTSSASLSDRPLRARRTLLLLTAILLLAVIARPGIAAPLVLYSNLAGPPSVDEPPIPFTPTAWFANQFHSFGSQSVIASLSLALQDVQALADLQIDLYDNVHNATSGNDEPNARIGGFRAGARAADVYQFVLTTLPWLDANSSYWIVASAKPASAGSAVWIWTTLEPSGANPLNPGQSLAQSQLWATGDGSSWTVASGSPFQMELSVTVVPEPSTWATGGVGVAIACGMGLRRRSRRTAPQPAA